MKYLNLLSSTALACAALVSPALAQDDDDEEIVVTGTNIRGVAPVGADPTVLTREDIEESGQSQVSEILRQLPQAQSNSAYSDLPLPNSPYGIQTGGFVTSNPTRGAAVDLRGLGPNATLVLVDGRRQLATGTTESFVEANRVPPSALERIEVVTDGASAIYGSDAVAGVVNYITRKDYEGLEFSGRYTFNDTYEQWGGAITGGTTWDLGGRRGNVIATYDYDFRDRVTRADNPRFGADQTAYGGNNSIYAAGSVPTPSGDGFYSANVCPPEADFYFEPNNICIDLTGGVTILGEPTVQYFDLAGLDPVTGAPVASSALAFPTNVQSSDPFSAFQPEQVRNSLNVYVNQDLTSWLSAYAQATVSVRETTQISYNRTTVTVTDESPFFPDFTGTAPEEVSVPVQNISQTVRESEDYQDAITVGLRADLGRDWEGEFYATRSTAEFSPNVNSGGSRSPTQAALSRLALRGEYNPFSGMPISQDLLDAATYQGGEDIGSESEAEAWDYVLKFNGPLFELPGGEIRVAVGAEYATFENAYTLSDVAADCADDDDNDATDPTPAAPRCVLTYARNDIRSGTAERDVSALFGEIYIPIVGENNSLPFVQRFDINLAARWEDYSDFGQTLNPRVGFTWDWNDEFTIRGSWGESYRAPNLTELSASSLPYVFTNPDNRVPPANPADPAPQTIQLTLNGANPDLGPETATNWSLGFDYRPSFLSGLRMSASYYEVDYTDKIAIQNVTFFLEQDTAALYAPFVIDVVGGGVDYPNCDPQDPTTYAPEVAAVMNTPPTFEVNPGDICRVQTILDGRWQNSASVVQTGMDLDISYRWTMGRNDFDAGLNVNKIFSIEETLVAGGPMTTPDPLGRIYMPLDFRARGNFRWRRGPFSANLTIHYLPEYTNDIGFIRIYEPPTANDPQGPTVEIDSWTTADLSLSYDIRDNESMGFLNGVRLGLNITNITDEDAPIVLSGTSLNTSYDGRAHNPYGRTFNIQLTKRF